MAAHHKTEVRPVVEEIMVHVYAVGLAQVFGYQGSDGGEVLGLEGVFVLHVVQVAG